MTKEWTIKTFVTARKVEVFKEWLNGLPIADKVKIKTMLKYLAITKAWTRPYTGKLKGYDDLVEIRVKSSNIQYRPIGCYGPKKKEFTILYGAIEKGNKLEPKNTLEIANKRSKLINKKGYTIEYEYD